MGNFDEVHWKYVHLHKICGSNIKICSPEQTVFRKFSRREFQIFLSWGDAGKAAAGYFIAAGKLNFSFVQMLLNETSSKNFVQV